MNTAGWISENRTRLLDELFVYLRVPSVSTDPAYAHGITDAAALLLDRCTRIGLHGARLLASDGHPVVYAEWLGAPGAPTILVYGHYDVQPPDPLEAWTTPPFAPDLRDGRIYARGASDDKCPVWVALGAIEAVLAVDGALPVNLKLLLEGEEEVGSRSLPAILARERGLLAANVLISADGGRWRPGVASVNTCMRGLTELQIGVRTAAVDLHSGRYGGAVDNAAMVLARLVASLHDDQHRIAVAGFHDGLKRLSNADAAALAALDFDPVALLASVGASAPAMAPGVGMLEALWFRPTLEVNGIWGGYQGPGGKTVIPHAAGAKLSCRLGAGQDPVAVAAAIAAHLRALCPPTAQLDVTIGESVAAYAVPDDDPALAAVERTIRAVSGVTPVRVGIGATLPVATMIKEILGLETVMFSFATSDERMHAPDEFFRLSSFDEGLTAWVRLLSELRSIG